MKEKGSNIVDFQIGVVGQFVEFFGPGVAALSIADRATIANMCPGKNTNFTLFHQNSKMHFLQNLNSHPSSFQNMAQRQLSFLRMTPP